MLRSPLAILFVTVALDLIGFGMVVPLMPLYARSFGVSASAIALLLAVYSLMQLFFAPLWGAWSDRVGRRRALLYSMAGNVAALVAFATAQSFGQLFVSRAMAGIATANISVASAYIADSTTPANRARGMGLLGAAFGLGFVIGPFFAGELARYGTHVPPLVAAMLAAINLAMAWLRLPESLPRAAREAAHEATHHGASWAAKWRVLAQSSRTKPLLVLVFVQILGFSMMEMALTLMVAARLGFDQTACGRLLAFTGVVLVVVQGGLMGRLSRRFGEVALLRAGLGAMALGLGVIPASTGRGLGALLGGLAVLAVGQGLVSPSLSALVSRSVNAAHQGVALGLAQSSSALARVVGPAVAGALYTHYSDAMPFWFGAVVVGTAAATAWALPAATQRAPQAS